MSETLTGRLNFRLNAEQEPRCVKRPRSPARASQASWCRPQSSRHEVLARANEVRLSDAAFRDFVAALDEPTEVVPELVRLFERNSRIPAR